MKKNFLIFIMSFNIYFESNLLNLCHGFKEFFFETHNVNFSLYLFSLSRFFFFYSKTQCRFIKSSLCYQT